MTHNSVQYHFSSSRFFSNGRICPKMFIHCVHCIKEMPAGTSPREWAKLEVGWTKQGLQVWCKRHEINVLHVHFEGQKHPANSTMYRPPPPSDEQELTE